MQDIPAYQLGIFRKAGGQIIPIEKVNDVNPDIIVDAIIGYSLISVPRGKVLEMIKFINENEIPTISLDIPTGLLATSGENPGEFVKPEITLTLALPKTGLYPDKCGEIMLADIGIPKVVYEKIGLKYNSPFSDKYIIPISVKE
jgi:NAD(P)H-hydrate epimerase